MGSKDIIGLTGYARTGKDTIGQYLVDHYGYTRVAFADAVRDAVYALNPYLPPAIPKARVRELVDSVGWDRAKTEPEVRELLQRMGTEVGRDLFGADFWIERAFDKVYGILNNGGLAVITDVRFDNEAATVWAWGGETWRIERDGTGPINNHVSDQIDFEVDTIIRNDGTLEDLYYEVDKLLS